MREGEVGHGIFQRINHKKGSNTRKKDEYNYVLRSMGSTQRKYTTQVHNASTQRKQQVSYGVNDLVVGHMHVDHSEIFGQPMANKNNAVVDQPS